MSENFKLNNFSNGGNINYALELGDDLPKCNNNLSENEAKKANKENDAETELPKVIFEDLPYEPSPLSEKLEHFWDNVSEFFKKHANALKTLKLVLLAVAFNCYFIAALAYFIQQNKSVDDLDWCHGLGLLVLITVAIYWGIFYGYGVKYFINKTTTGASVARSLFMPARTTLKKLKSLKHFSLILYSAVIVAFVIFVVIDSSDDRRRLISAFGLVAFILIGTILSKHPARIRWRHVAWGVSLQFIFGVIILRWDVGREIFECIGHKVETFLDYTDAGTGFIFGHLATPKVTPFNLKLLQNRSETAYEVAKAINDYKAAKPIFFFKALSVIYFVSFFLSMLFYLGVVQWVIEKVGWLLQITVGTTACESMIAASNVFLGLAEAPLIIRPYVRNLTPSELHSVMTSGFSTVAGGVLAALISVNVSATHLLSASLMSAPAALACAKLLYPETKKSKTTAKDLEPVKARESNLLDAASHGAGSASSLVANIAANLIAIISFVTFINAVLQWTGSLVGADYFTFEFLLGKIFIPVSWLMGIENDDLEIVGQLLGIKTFMNTMVAYFRFPQVEHLISPRSKMIATYALCGFSNPASIGITIASLSEMAPERRPDIAATVLRAFFAGGMASCMTACVAGTLISTD